MAVVTTGPVDLIVIIAIGIVVGLVFNRYGRSWLGRRVADVTGVGDITYSLVGICRLFYRLSSRYPARAVADTIDVVSCRRNRCGDYDMAVAWEMTSVALKTAMLFSAEGGRDFEVNDASLSVNALPKQNLAAPIDADQRESLHWRARYVLVQSLKPVEGV